jgi:lipoyl(octanoyl) transferase
MSKNKLIIRELGLQDYQTTWDKMREFTNNRDEHTQDELWLLSHPRIFTQGQTGKAEHILNPHDIPVVQSDRGGQVTYHGPGQLVGYCLFDLKRRGIGIRSLVKQLEQTLMDVLAKLEIKTQLREGAPGVFVDQAKIASLGLRVRRGYTYHGFSLNVDMDLTPFDWINTCGFQGLSVTQVADFSTADMAQVIALCRACFLAGARVSQ